MERVSRVIRCFCCVEILISFRSGQVLMKDIMTPVPPEEVRAVIKKCLENAALINYNKLASEAKVEGEL